MGTHPAGAVEPLTDHAATTDLALAERTRVLVVATVGFTVFFAVWVMFAIVGIPVA